MPENHHQSTCGTKQGKTPGPRQLAEEGVSFPLRLSYSCWISRDQTQTRRDMTQSLLGLSD